MALKKTEQPNEQFAMTVRMDHSVLASMDALRNQRIVPPSRSAWVLEAILEKIIHNTKKKEK